MSSSPSLEFLKKGVEDFTQDDWVQYLELHESLGGSAAIKAAQSGSAEPAQDRDTLSVGITAEPQALILQFSLHKPGWAVNTVNPEPPTGAGYVVGSGLKPERIPGIVVSAGDPKCLLETRWVDFTFSGKYLLGRFRTRRGGPVTGIFQYAPKHEATIPEGLVNAAGVFKFSA